MVRLQNNYSVVPPVIKVLLVANSGLFVAELINSRALIDWLALWPNGEWNLLGMTVEVPHFWPWQLVTYAFLHGSVIHLLLNMYALCINCR